MEKYTVWLFHATLVSMSILVGIVVAANSRTIFMLELTVIEVIGIIVATIASQTIIAAVGWFASMHTFRKIIEIKMDYQDKKLDAMMEKIGKHNKFDARLVVLETRAKME